MSDIINPNYKMEERFIAFLDILGFTKIIEKIEISIDKENSDLIKIKSILNFMNEESKSPNYGSDLPVYIETGEGLIEKELGDLRLTYISDCIIISAEPTMDGFKALSRKIHKITADLAYDGIFCRGAISKGKLFHRDNILFGSAYIRAYKLEEEISCFPRVIIDPDIIPFFALTEDKVPLGPISYGKDKDGYYYQRYWTWFLFPPYAGEYETYLNIVKSHIEFNLNKFDYESKEYKKYQWLKTEFNDLISWWAEINLYKDNFELIS